MNSASFRNRHNTTNWTPILAGALALIALGFATQGIAADAAPAADMHTFTNTSGASFKAAITSVSGDTVNLKREDGKTISPNVLLFSKEDRAFIRQWAARKAAEHGPGIFEFHAHLITGHPSTATVKSGGYQSSSTAWQDHYELETKNTTMVNWGALHFRFMIFKLRANFGKLPPDDFTLQSATSSIDVARFTASGTKSFPTDTFNLYEEKRTGAQPAGNGSAADVADEIKGIWVRVYDEDENLLQEWDSGTDIIKIQLWNFPGPQVSKRSGTTISTRGQFADRPNQANQAYMIWYDVKPASPIPDSASSTAPEPPKPSTPAPPTEL